VQRDPIGYEAKDVSLYRYVGNQTTISIDIYGLAVFESDGYKIEVHKTDADCQIPGGHGHFQKPDNLSKGGYKVSLTDGAIYTSNNKFTGATLNKRVLEKLKKWIKCQGLTGCLVAVIIMAPEIANAAYSGGAEGVGDYLVHEATQVATGTVVAGGVGATVIGGTAMTGGTMTMGGTTIVSGGTIATGVGAGTAVTVGGAVVVAGAGGYAVGTVIANTKPGKWVTTGVGEGMAWVCPWCFRW